MLKRLALWVVRLELPILFILAPFFIFPSAARSPSLLGIPLVWIARKIAHGRFVRRTPLDWAIALLLLMVLVSLYATYSVMVSLPRIAGILLGIAIYYAVVEVVQSRKALAWACTLYLVAGVGVAGLALVGMEKISKIPLLGQVVSRLPRLVRGLSENPEGLHPNIVAGALLWFIPLGLILTVWLWQTGAGGERQKAWSLLAFAGVLGITGVLVLTQSRGGLIGLGVASVLLVARTGRLGKRLAVVAMVAVVVALGVIGPGRIGEALVGKNVGTTPVSGLETLNGRVELWSRALYAIQDFPFTGMGMGTFGYVVPVLYPLFTVSPDVVILHAHDEFLQVAVDLGLPGLVSFLAIYLLIGWTLLAVLRRDTDPFYHLMAFAILAGLISHVAWGMTDAILLGAKPAVFWWALLGLGAATFLLMEQAGVGSAIYHSTAAKAGESPAPDGVATH